MSDSRHSEFVLGLDLGTNSLGWAVVRLVDDVPAGLLSAGVRIFPAGVNVDPKSGKEKTLNAQRREARQQRRQTRRRKRRLMKIARILQMAELLPPGDIRDPGRRQFLFENLDRDIRRSAWFRERAASGRYPEPDQTMAYILRACSASGENLHPHYLGRGLYHLAQRRGYWNIGRATSKDADSGTIGPAIESLRGRLGDQTLGQYFAQASPLYPACRIRDVWTARDMYQREFKTIWEQQAHHHPGLLTDELYRKLYNAIFNQRPLKLKKNLVGRCEFESHERRAPAYLLISQRFRLLQAVNNFAVHGRGEGWRPLTTEERTKLVAELQGRSHMKFKEVRELLGFTQRHSINLQRDNQETKVPGDETSAQLRVIFGEKWPRVSQAQNGIVADIKSILSVRDADARRMRARKYLGNRGVAPVDDAVEKLLAIEFEAGYASLSVKAMERFVPLLECGFRYGALSPHYRQLADAREALIRLIESGQSHEAACANALTNSAERRDPELFLPPVLSSDVQQRIGVVRNPIVIRSLTEVRKVVNAILEKFGKPTKIHIELLRELKKPKDVREKIWKENIGRESRNDQIEREILNLAPELRKVGLKDIEKYRLWKESELCPYCVKGPMTPRLLFGSDSEYQIDHIIPFSFSLDDSFANKVLCHAACNQTKGDMTPFQRFGRSDNWDAILHCVSRFPADFRDEKLRRFRMDGKALEEYLAKRPAQQFNDSAYASRLAADYLALLYGGRADAEGNLRVQARSGGLTKNFREAWKLNSILGDGDTTNGGKDLKPRHNYAHHALDAAVIAVTDQDMVARLNRAARAGWHRGNGRFGDFPEPWPGFKNDLRTVLSAVVISHRVSNKVSGRLHKETNYSPNVFGRSIRRHRIDLKDLSTKQIASESAIPDKRVREIIRAKFDSLGGGDPKKVFSDGKNLPCFTASGGRCIPIKRVRVEETIKTRRIGAGPTERYVKPGGNHHLEVFGLPEPGGRDQKWDTPGVVTMLEAYERLKDSPVVKKRPEGGWEGWEFRFSLAPNEILTFDAGPHKGRHLVVRGISQEEKRDSVKIEMAPINDARVKNKIKESKLWITKSPNELLKWQARKVIVSPIGEVNEAHD